MFKNFTFENPEYFWLLLLLPLLVGWYIWRRNQQQAALKIGNSQGFSATDIVSKLHPILSILKLLAIVFIVIALARPRTVEESTQVKTNKGIDIAMAIDISGSMLAKDLKPDRLEALKGVAADFVKGRLTDRIGLVIYSGEAYTKTPVTSDKNIILKALNGLKFSEEIAGGTAIGMGLGTAVNRLKESKAKSKVVILLTDGTNNAGFVDPIIAAELAAEYGIKVYTIGVGTNGNALTPVARYPNGKLHYEMRKVEIDEKLLKDIAKKTGGQYFRATNNRNLKKIYAEIDKLEKTDLEELKFTSYDEKYRVFTMIAFACIALSYLLKQTVFKSFI